MKIKTSSKSWLVKVSVVVAVLVLAGLLYLKFQPKDNANQPSVEGSAVVDEPDSPKPPARKPSVLKFAAMGDMLGHDSVISNAKTSQGYDFKKYFMLCTLI